MSACRPEREPHHTRKCSLAHPRAGPRRVGKGGHDVHNFVHTPAPPCPRVGLPTWARRNGRRANSPTSRPPLPTLRVTTRNGRDKAGHDAVRIVRHRRKTPMITLYYAPGACSMAAHIVLEESGEKYTPQRVDLAKGEQKTDAYLKIHPLGRVPALRLDSGEPLAENTAILPYLGKRFGLWPT